MPSIESPRFDHCEITMAASSRRVLSIVVLSVLFACLLGFASPTMPTTAGRQGPIDASGTLTPEQKEILDHMSVVYLEDGQGGRTKTIRFTGANVQIVNGLGRTDSPPDGLGNLILGYNELRDSGNLRTGSHNLIAGAEHNYTFFGGLVAGRHNSIIGRWASVSGGFHNRASRRFTSVSGGSYNTASARYASISGGSHNTADENGSSVSGGTGNRASGFYSSVSGGVSNTAGNFASSVSGGLVNRASGASASVSGGSYNTASARYSSVTGGRENRATGFHASVSGGQRNVASGGTYYLAGGSISGGRDNIASAYSSSVSGGASRSATGDDDWAAGTLFEDD